MVGEMGPRPGLGGFNVTAGWALRIPGPPTPFITSPYDRDITGDGIFALLQKEKKKGEMQQLGALDQMCQPQSHRGKHFKLGQFKA